MMLLRQAIPAIARIRDVGLITGNKMIMSFTGWPRCIKIQRCPWGRVETGRVMDTIPVGWVAEAFSRGTCDANRPAPPVFAGNNVVSTIQL
jgi:hypothetical protein